MVFSPSTLTPLQLRILDVIAGRLAGVFFTGGAALAAAHLGHRRSVDLDLFTRDAASFDDRVHDLLRLVAGAGLVATAGQAGPGFRRFVVSDGAEEVPVDLVVDTTPAIAPPTALPNGLPVDSIEDIAANKLGAVLGRSEVRDLVDLLCLQRRGMDLVALVPAARRKDGGLDAATLAFVLSQVKVHGLPAGLEMVVTAAELQAFVDDLRRRLARAAFPAGP